MQTSSPHTPPEEEEKQSLIAKTIDCFESVSNWCDEAWIKVNRLTETNYELGFQMAQEGRVDDAIMRFRITLWLAPNHEPTLYNLGCLYHDKGENQKALALFTRLVKANPAHANALYMIATINPTMLKPEMRPTTVPMTQLIEYFNNYAGSYDADMTQQNYRLPAVLHELLRPMLDADAAKDDMLDIGCGTGLLGTQFSAEFANIIGVDVSSEMLKPAYQRMDKRGIRVYNQLIHQDIHNYLVQEKIPQFNVISMLAVLPYIGDLQRLAPMLAKALKKGGVLALSFDSYDQPQGYGVLVKTGYFAHSPAYVEQAMRSAGLEIFRRGEVEATTGRHAQLCFFRHAEASE